MLALTSIVMATAVGAEPEWSDRFYQGDFQQTVFEVASVPTPGGPRLYAAGGLSRVGGMPGGNIGEWDGEEWTLLNGGTNGVVRTLGVYDDGNGAALYVGGAFETAGVVPCANLARWDGTSWSPLGGGLSRLPGSMVVHDDGRGPSLFVGGTFFVVDDADIDDIARWDGTEWTAVGSGHPEGIGALIPFDDGSGLALYAGGYDFVEKWDGASWTSCDAGLSGRVRALAVYDDGNGAALYAGGELELDGATETSLAKWNGKAWGTVDGYDDEDGDDTWDLLVHDDGSGSALYLAGRFLESGLRRFDGTAWEDVDGGPNSVVYSITRHGDDLVAGGAFSSAGGAPTSGVAAWDGAAWSAVGSGNPGNGVKDLEGVLDMHVVGPHVVGFDDPQLCMIGGFHVTGAMRTNFVAQWDGRQWDRLGNGIPLEQQGQSLATFGAPPTRHLYAAARDVYRWDGLAWTSIAQASTTIIEIREIEVAGETALYAGGIFTTIDGVEANRIARFDGTSWHPLDTGADNWVYTLASFDDGSGPVLVAGGRFTTIGGQPANHVAQWDGKAWSPLGDGVDDWVYELVTTEFGEGPELVVGGRFDTAGGVAAPNVARWDGATWSAAGSGTNDDVWSIGVFDDGRGSALYVGGEFSEAGGVPAAKIARYDGATWEALDVGVTGGAVFAVEAFDDHAGPALHVGGSIFTAGGSSSLGIARWGCAPCAGDADGNGLVDFADVLAVLTKWGPCPGCPEDLNADAIIDFADILEILANWGPCD